MRITVDGKPHPVLAAPLHLAGVISDIDAVLEHQGRGIQEIRINGEPWTIQMLEDRLDALDLEAVKTLEVRSESMRALVGQSLAELDRVIDELPAACHSFAALLNSPDRQAALDEFDAFVEVWEELLDRHGNALEALGTKPSAVSIHGIPLDAWQVRAWKVVEEGAAMAAAGDAVRLADLLTYDLLPYAEEEALVLEQLRALTASG